VDLSVSVSIFSVSASSSWVRTVFASISSCSALISSLIALRALHLAHHLFAMRFETVKRGLVSIGLARLCEQDQWRRVP
jgi:hypothetical protein